MPSQQENKERREGWVGGREWGIRRGGQRVVKCTHTEKTRCFLASRCDGRRPPTNKSEAVKRQDAEKGIRSDATTRSGLPREERRVRNVRADAHTQRKRETSLA